MGTKGESEQGSGRSEEEQITISSGTAQKTTEARKGLHTVVNSLNKYLVKIYQSNPRKSIQ